MSRELTSACKMDCPYFNNYRCLLPFDKVCLELSSSVTTTYSENDNVVMDTILKCLGIDKNNYTPDYCDVCGEEIEGKFLYGGKKEHFIMCDKCKTAILMLRNQIDNK